MTIQLFDALAGSGKTRALTREADRLAKAGQKALIIQPTKLLIEKMISDELQPLRPKYRHTAIHSGRDGSVVRTLTDHLFEAEPGIGEIVFATHAAFFKLPWFPRWMWNLIFDEVPAVDVYEEHRLAETHELLMPLLSVRPHDAVYGVLSAAEAA